MGTHVALPRWDGLCGVGSQLPVHLDRLVKLVIVDEKGSTRRATAVVERAHGVLQSPVREPRVNGGIYSHHRKDLPIAQGQPQRHVWACLRLFVASGGNGASSDRRHLAQVGKRDHPCALYVILCGLRITHNASNLPAAHALLRTRNCDACNGGLPDGPSGKTRGGTCGRQLVP